MSRLRLFCIVFNFLITLKVIQLEAYLVVLIARMFSLLPLVRHWYCSNSIQYGNIETFCPPRIYFVWTIKTYLHKTFPDFIGQNI